MVEEGIKINLDDYIEAGTMTGPDNKEYLILIERSLRSDKIKRIMNRLNLGTLSIRDRIWWPERPAKPQVGGLVDFLRRGEGQVIDLDEDGSLR